MSEPSSFPYRILVTGWRDWPRSAAYVVHHALTVASAEPLSSGRIVLVVEGQCPYGGADEYAFEWAEAHRPLVIPERHPAPWKQLGKAAGFYRNTHMVNLGADVCLGFPGPPRADGKRSGTQHCMDEAKAAGITVVTYPWRPSYADGPPKSPYPYGRGHPEPLWELPAQTLDDTPMSP